MDPGGRNISENGGLEKNGVGVALVLEGARDGLKGALVYSGWYCALLLGSLSEYFGRLSVESFLDFPLGEHTLAYSSWLEKWFPEKECPSGPAATSSRWAQAAVSCGSLRHWQCKRRENWICIGRL